jgi:hypothetical protein
MNYVFNEYFFLIPAQARYYQCIIFLYLLEKISIVQELYVNSVQLLLKQQFICQKSQINYIYFIW